MKISIASAQIAQLWHSFLASLKSEPNLLKHAIQYGQNLAIYTGRQFDEDYTKKIQENEARGEKEVADTIRSKLNLAHKRLEFIFEIIKQFDCEVQSGTKSNNDITKDANYEDRVKEITKIAAITAGLDLTKEPIELNTATLNNFMELPPEDHIIS